MPPRPPQIISLPNPALGITIDPNMANLEEWYTTEDVMRHLKMSRSTVYRLRRKRELPAYKLGNIIVFPKHFINTMLLQRATLNLKQQHRPNPDSP
ncbi:helix-turn-helix domain-containing protein [Geojedonia litorea]|uniref:Helix-turn-helix domain-containing protein n=1 Tax=Geojedonia litorea TaxID=1268269 RepID=A0ABV9N1U3_9FLAO